MYYDFLRIFTDEYPETSELTKENLENLKRNHFNNLRTYGVSYTLDCNTLIFHDKKTYENWLYYAGLEYCEDGEINKIEVQGNFIAWVERKNDSDNRIDTLLDIITTGEPK